MFFFDKKSKCFEINEKQQNIKIKIRVFFFARSD